MNIKEAFKLYPVFEPSYNGTRYLTLVKVGPHICYAITYFNNDGSFEPEHGEVVAFADVQPYSIFIALTGNPII